MTLDSAYLLIFALIMVLERVKKYIADYQLFAPDARLLLAVSGGGDSMAMLDLLHSEGYYFEVAHVNFQLRGEDSDRDEALVTSVCKAKGVILHCQKTDTRQYAQDHKQSIEMAAREIRYDFFEDLMDQQNLQYVVVAHHRNDVVETFFINLMRGTGLRGLSGILPKNGRVVRPLLATSHEELISYLEERNLDYCTDVTNFDTTILRNELRHRIIPDFEDKKPGFGEIMQRTVTRLRQSEAVVNAFVEEWREKHIQKQGEELFIPKKELTHSVSASEILFHILQPMGFSIASIDELSSQSVLRIGARFDAPNYRLIVDREHLIVGPRQEDESSYSIPKRSQTITAPVAMKISESAIDASFVVVKDKRIALLDADALTFPLTLRHWKEGDVFCPIGMKGKQKKVSDYFIDQKFSIPEKEKIWLLCSGEYIVWIVGHRLDERYKITETASSLFKIEL